MASLEKGNSGIAELLAKITDLTSKLETCNTDQITCTKQLNDLRSSCSNLETLQEEIRILTRKVAELETMLGEAEKTKTALANEKAGEARQKDQCFLDLASKTSELGGKAQEVTTLTHQLEVKTSELVKKTSEVSGIQLQYDECRKSEFELSTDKKTLTDQNKLLRTEVETANEEKEAAEQKTTDVESKYKEKLQGEVEKTQSAESVAKKLRDDLALDRAKLDRCLTEQRELRELRQKQGFDPLFYIGVLVVLLALAGLLGLYVYRSRLEQDRLLRDALG